MLHESLQHCKCSQLAAPGSRTVTMWVQCVCDWEDRDKKFVEIEGVVRRQIKVLMALISLSSAKLSMLADCSLPA